MAEVSLRAVWWGEYAIAVLAEHRGLYAMVNRGYGPPADLVGQEVQERIDGWLMCQLRGEFGTEQEARASMPEGCRLADEVVGGSVEDSVYQWCSLCGVPTYLDGTRRLIAAEESAAVRPPGRVGVVTWRCWGGGVMERATSVAAG